MVKINPNTAIFDLCLIKKRCIINIENKGTVNRSERGFIMKYQTLLTNIKRGLNVMYFITKESDKSVINDIVYEPSEGGSFRTLLHNVTIDTDLTKGAEIKIEISDEKDPVIRFYKTVLNDDNMAIRYQYLFGVCTYKKCIAEIIAEIYQTMDIIVNHYC